MISGLGDRLVYGDSMTVEDVIIEVLGEDEEKEQETKTVVDKVVNISKRWSRAEVVSALFQLEYEGRIYQVYRDEWRINPAWC